MSAYETTPSAPASTRPRVVADVIAATLAEHGVDRVFLMTGGDLSLWRSLRDVGIQMVLARSEASSVVMADAYARLTGRPAVVYGQWGPGAANVAGALADAWWASAPVVALTSTVPTSSEFRREYQELDQPPMFAPVTKWQARINTADRAADLVAQAVTMAAAGLPGPVHLDIASDLIKAPFTPSTPVPRPGPTLLRPPANTAAVSEAVELLSRADKPVILAGAGIIAGEGWDALASLAEGLSIPVATTMGGKGSFREDHPLSLGVAGRYSRKVANAVLRDADFVLALGTDLGGLASDSYRLPTATAKLVHVDIDAAAIGRTMPVTHGVVGDAGAVCSQLLEAARAVNATASPEWAATVRQRTSAWWDRFREIAEEPAVGHVRPEAVAWILREFAGPDDTVIADTGFTGAWAGTLYPVHSTGRTFTRAAGTLGWAFPAVLGAQLARPEVRAFALVGDGGFGYNVGDIETAVRLRIPAITLVLNNACLAYEYVAYEIGYQGDIVDEVCDFQDVDFGAVARSFGAFGARARSADELRTALKEALAQDGPAVIDIVVSKTRFAPVTSFDGALDRDL